MKIHYFFKEIAVFSVVFVFLLMPSLFQSIPEEGTFSTWNFPLAQIIFMLFSFFFVFFEANSFSLMDFLSGTFFKGNLRRGMISFFSGFLLLFVSASFFQFAASFSTFYFPDVNFIRPENFRKWIFCILAFFSGAILEENIFRIYLPCFFRKFFPQKFRLGFLQLVPEFFPCILFALCHRYLGIFAVLNAFTAHIILRFVFLKDSSPLLNYSIHFFYNILNIFVMLSQ